MLDEIGRSRIAAACAIALHALAGAAMAQTWSKTYGTARWETGSIQPERDGADAVIGYHVTGVLDAGGLPATHDAFLMKLDQEGSIEWQRQYHVDGIDFRPFLFHRLDDGTWYTIGSTLNPASAGYDMHVARADALGNVTWSQTYGDAADDFGIGFLLADDGVMLQIDKDLSPTAGGNGLWLIRLDRDGDIIWQKTYDGPDTETGSAWEILGDGYLLSARTRSFGAGEGDNWVLKLDDSGNVEWQKVFGTPSDDFATARPMHDEDRSSPGGHVITGLSFSAGPRGNDTVVIKLDLAGNVEWEHVYGTAVDDNLNFTWEYDDGGSLTGYFLSGFARDGLDIDAVVARLDLAGNIVWQRTIGGAGMDLASIRRADDGSLYLIGTTDSFGAGGMDAWIVKLDDSGNVEWQKTYGGPADENTGADFVHDGTGALVGIDIWGYTESFGGGDLDTWWMRVDTTGEILWQRAYGGAGRDLATPWFSDSASLVLSGSTTSFGVGDQELWLAQLDAEGRLEGGGCPAVDTTAVAMDSTAEIRDADLVATPAGWSVADTAVVPTDTAVTPGTLTFDVMSGTLVEEEQCSGLNGIAPIRAVMLERSGGNIVITWEPSGSVGHASYRVRGASTARPMVGGGSFPDDPPFNDITDLDLDGDDTNESFTLDAGSAHVFFLVTDVDGAGTEGLAGHYP